MLLAMQALSSNNFFITEKLIYIKTGVLSMYNIKKRGFMDMQTLVITLAVIAILILFYYAIRGVLLLITLIKMLLNKSAGQV